MGVKATVVDVEVVAVVVAGGRFGHLCYFVGGWFIVIHGT